MQYHTKTIYLNVITYSIEELKKKADDDNLLEISNQAIQVFHF